MKGLLRAINSENATLPVLSKNDNEKLARKTKLKDCLYLVKVVPENLLLNSNNLFSKNCMTQNPKKMQIVKYHKVELIST